MTVNTRLGKITASREVLNILSIALFEAADSLQAWKGIEKRDVFGYNTAANEIFDALDETGGTTQNNNKLTYRLDGRKRGKKNEKI